MRGGRFSSRLSFWGMLVVLILAACSLAAGQVVVYGWPTSGGLVVPVPQGTVPLTAPQAAIVNLSNSPVGATDATGGNIAGATDATINNIPAVSSASTIQMVVNNSGVQGVAPQATGEQPATGTGSSVLTSGTFNPGTFNPGVAEFSSAYAVADLSSAYAITPYSDGHSIAEVAAENRARAQQVANIPTFTNQDVQHLNQNSGVTIATATRPANMGGMAGATESAMGTRQPAAPASNAAAAGAAPSPFSPRAPITTEQAQSAETKSQSQASSEPASQEARPSRRLPTTASFLPLVALLGILAGVAGILCRK